MSRVDELKGQLAQVDALVRDGVLKGRDAKRRRDQLEAELLDAIAKPAATAGMAADAPAQVPMRLLLSVLAFVLAFGTAGYAWRGNLEALAVGPGEQVAQAAGDAAPQVTPEQIEAMTQRLADRLKEKPDDPTGWVMLGRSYSVLGKHAQAVDAYRKLVSLQPDDASGYAELADAVGMANGRKLDGEPEKLIAKALQLDPEHAKALSLAGTVAYDHGDFAGAAKHWERALRKFEPGSEMAQQLQGVIADARQRAGQPVSAAATTPVAAASGPATGGSAPTAAAAANVQVKVSLAPALAGKAAPEDTLYIFARAAQGGRAPLAIQRLQVKNLPLEITLDDSMAMSPAMRLSSVTQVIVGARISKSGNPIAQPGDLQGLSQPVTVGSRGIQLQIAEEVR